METSRPVVFTCAVSRFLISLFTLSVSLCYNKIGLLDFLYNLNNLNKTGEIALIHVNTILRNVEQLKADALSAAR